jgi:hypothetical protein
MHSSALDQFDVLITVKLIEALVWDVLLPQLLHEEKPRKGDVKAISTSSKSQKSEHFECEHDKCAIKKLTL